MADKMMRIAGRGSDGLAKAIKTDNEGRIETKTSYERKLFNQAVTLQRGESVKTEVLDSLGYTHGNLILNIAESRAFKVTIIERDWQEGVLYESPRVVFQGVGTGVVNISYEINSKEYQLEITATGRQGLWIRSSSFEILTNNTIKNDSSVKYYEKELFDGYNQINRNESLTSERINSFGYNRGKLNINIYGTKQVKVTVIDIRKTGYDNEYLKRRTIFEGSVSDFETVYFPIYEDLFQVEIESISSETMIMGATSVQLMNDRHVVLDQKQFTNIETQLTGIKESISKKQRPTKYPSGLLAFKHSPKNIHTLYKGTDEYFYVVTHSGVLEKHETIVEDKEPIETGITWDFETNGDLVYLFVQPDGVVFFSNLIVDGKTYPRVYRSDSIQNEPSLVYEGDNSGSSQWSRHFGVDHYYNGVSYYLAGLYSSGNPTQFSRDLILSTNGGKTFNVIKQTTNQDTSGSFNSHWHDVAIDPYHGLLWATEGDGPINRHIWYSEDFGENWVALADDEQPTSIIPYPDKIVFGRDGKNVGFDSLDYPDSIAKLNRDLIKTKREFKSQSGVTYFALKPVVYKNETYANFFLYGEAHTPMVVASGDFGETWHGVWFDKWLRGKMYKLVAVDDKYVYAYNADSSRIIYSEKPEWI